jgi:hypothetical protein
MTATTIELHDYVEALRSAVPYVHPAGRATIDEWLTEMHEASYYGATATFAKIAQRITMKVVQELEWYARDTHLRRPRREATHVDR